MKQNNTVLENLNKIFEHNKVVRNIDSIGHIEVVKSFKKFYNGLHLKQ
jgi:hypothetical protein